MTIQIEDHSLLEASVCVMIDGICNHGDKEYKTKGFTGYSFWADAGVHVPDDPVYEEVLVCNRCDAWQDDDGSWNDEEA